MNPEHEQLIADFRRYGYTDVEVLASHGEHHLARCLDRGEETTFIAYYNVDSGSWDGWTCDHLAGDPSHRAIEAYNPESLRYLLNLYKLLLP